MNVAKLLFGTAPFILGLTSGYGAIEHGNDPTYSFVMSAVGLITLILINTFEKR